MRLRNFLVQIHSILSAQLGFDLLRLGRTIRGFPRYLLDRNAFKKHYNGRLTWKPYLQDRFQESGTTNSEYFWQDLLVAQWIHEANPTKHVDVGSRVDGFVAHVASFRHIEVFDIRPLARTIPGTSFKQANLMNFADIENLIGDSPGYCDSVSCLHALEHFGLGRYGDPIDHEGYIKGFYNLVRLLKPGGVLYLSTPMGRERVEFNANWVFAPQTILTLASSCGLRLQKFLLFNPKLGVQDLSGETVERISTSIAQENYHLAIMQFARTHASLPESASLGPQHRAE